MKDAPEIDIPAEFAARANSPRLPAGSRRNIYTKIWTEVLK